jgi:hypothetical protein
MIVSSVYYSAFTEAGESKANVEECCGNSDYLLFAHHAVVVLLVHDVRM